MNAEPISKPELSTEEFDFGVVHFISEPTLQGYIHACTEQDVIAALRTLPAADLKGLLFIVFHQPTRKGEQQSPRWAAYYPEYTYRSMSGPAIVLEAIDPERPIKWGTSLEPDDQKELELLEREGHDIQREKKAIYITPSIASIKKTQLERSLVHEVGHHVDYMRDPAAFPKKSSVQKEAFANTYFALQAKQRNIR